MVAQLVRQNDGSYDYVEVDTRPKPLATTNFLSQVSTEAAKSLPVTNEFEAYEGAKRDREDLVSAPSITEQTEKITREIPGQVEFDEKTGQFITKKAKTVDLEYKKPEITPESTEPTALQKVMKVSEQMRPEPVDYSKIMRDAYQATRPSVTEQLIGAGKDIAISYMTQRVLSGTMAGQLAGGMMVNPYVASANILMQSGAGKQIAKGAGKAVSKIADTASNVWKAVTGGSVICSELCRQELISKEDYKIHWDYTMKKWNKDELKGYWLWAMPTAKKMKTNKWLTKFWLHIMKYKIQHVKYTLGKAKFTLKGYMYNLLIEQISLLISKLIKKKKTNEVLV
jgi:hypothetical protein